MSLTPRDIGTLIVVILRARNLPNKRHIGKQDPYCTVQFNSEKRRTKTIKRGGQHPEWDEEVRFTLYEDIEDTLARQAAGESPDSPTPPFKDGKRPKVKGGQTMLLCCYADDPREPDLIGEARVDLTEVLTKGETDEWFSLSYRDRYCGEVYLELTFWSNEPEPEKKTKQTAPKSNGIYGGTGDFKPAGGLKAPSDRRQPSSRSASVNGRQASGILPPSLTAHASASSLDLYVAPYERRASPVDQVTNEFGRVSLSGHSTPTSQGRRRESFPSTPTANDYGYQQPPGPPQQSYGYERPLTPPYDQGYQVQSHPTGYPTTQRRGGTRYSLPTASSGFVPLAPSVSSGFTTYPQHPPEGTGYGPLPPATPMPPTPMPPSYGPPVMTPGFAQGPPPTPSPHVPVSSSRQGVPLPLPPLSAFQPPSPQPPPQQSATMTYAQPPPQPLPPQNHPPQQSATMTYAQQQVQYPPPLPPMSALPTGYQTTPISAPSPSHSAPPPQHYAHQPGYDHPPPLPHHSHSMPMPISNSRPLPQPQSQPSPHRQSSLPMPPSVSGGVPPPPPISYNPGSTLPAPPSSSMIPSTPIPPPPPLAASPNGMYDPPPGGYPALPPPPPMSGHMQGGSPRPPLPNPPMGYATSQTLQSPYASVPPPPPLPTPPGGGYQVGPPRSATTQWATTHAGHAY